MPREGIPMYSDELPLLVQSYQCRAISTIPNKKALSEYMFPGKFIKFGHESLWNCEPVQISNFRSSFQFVRINMVWSPCSIRAKKRGIIAMGQSGFAQQRIPRWISVQRLDCAVFHFTDGRFG